MIMVDKHKMNFRGNIVDLMAEYSFLTGNIIRELASKTSQEEVEEYVKAAFELGVDGSKYDGMEFMKKKLQEMIDKL